jgi:hypothetical protein
MEDFLIFLISTICGMWGMWAEFKVSLRFSSSVVQWGERSINDFGARMNLGKLATVWGRVRGYPPAAHVSDNRAP